MYINSFYEWKQIFKIMRADAALRCLSVSRKDIPPKIVLCRHILIFYHIYQHFARDIT